MKPPETRTVRTPFAFMVRTSAVAALGEGDALANDLLDDGFGQSFEERDPLAQRRLEGDLAPHRALGDRRDMGPGSDEIGKFVDAFLLDHGRIHVGEEKALAPALALLHDDVDGQVRWSAARRRASTAAMSASATKGRSAATPVASSTAASGRWSASAALASAAEPRAGAAGFEMSVATWDIG